VVCVAGQVFGLLDMQEQLEIVLSRLAPALESTPSATILADFTQLYAMIRQEVRPAHNHGLSCTHVAVACLLYLQ
jgi:hypothetical protein